MHKRKPHKGLKKRVTVSAGGKVMRRMSGKGHLLSGKPGTRRQRLRKKVAVQGKFNERCLEALNAL